MAIGASVKRIEDPLLLTGKGQYVGDVHFSGQCEAVVLRSPHAHAKIRAIHCEEARKLPGVELILTADELPQDLAPIPMRLSGDKKLEAALQYPLAKERVRYVGDPVALVVAENRYVAEDALDLIKVEYEPLPAITDVYDALKDDAVILHPEAGSNDLFVIRSYKNSVDEALKKCQYVLTEELYVQRHSGIPMETRGLVATCGDDGKLTVYGAAKVVHFNHQILSKLLKKDPKEIRLVENDCGGGFGPRGEFYPEDFLIPYAALKLRKPVKWIEDRLEHLQATNHSREQKHRVTIGFDETGRIYAFRDEIFVDQGGYIRTHGVTVPALTQAMLPGPYDFHAIELVTHSVATNKTPCGTYRGPGRFEGNFVRERMIDIVAKKLNMDPTAVREINLIPKENLPYSNGISALGQVVELDSGNYAEVLRAARKAMGWEQFDSKKKQSQSEGRLLGMGFAMFVEKSGLGPWEFAELEICENGELICKTGLADVGQGVETALAQICEEQLGIPYEKVKVIHGDTDQVEKGNGSFATRGAVTGGSAVWYAAGKLKERLLNAAAKTLGKSSSSLALTANGIADKENKQTLLSLKELVAACKKQNVALNEKHTFSIDHMTYPYGCHAAEVEIDPETGAIKIEKFYISYDVGRAINPLLIKGQLVGGMAQGLGGTLYETLKYDKIGQLLTGTFMDYLIPTSMEVPEVQLEVFENAPSPSNPLGLKGVGEGGTVAVAPAIANAIMNALENYPIEITSLPIKPETIREAIKKKKMALR